VGNRDLLAVKLALEEWRHWLEGAENPFVVWTDHKNLAYIQSAKCLNTRQARWALFFGRFRFTLTVTWEIEALVKQAQQTQPDPGNGAPNRLFTPDSVRSQVLQWGHTSRIACHPGMSRTLSLIQRHF